MIDNNIRLLRTEFVNTQVITLNTGRKLGVVKELLVDLDRREVVALGLRDNALSLSGMAKYMYLNTIRQSGDVVLVDNEDVIEDIDIDVFSSLINSEVITEAGEPLGRVRDFQFNIENGQISSIIIASLGFPQIPEQVISTYELPIEQVVSTGPNRLIVFEGAEERLEQLTVGVLERLGIGKPIWDREDESGYFPPTVPTDNQLPESTVQAIPNPVEAKKTKATEKWDEDEWEETRIPAPPLRKQRAEMEREYETVDLEEDNWGEVKREKEIPSYEPKAPRRRQPEYDYADDDINGDVWDDDVKPSNNPPLNIPIKKKQKAPEYEEETN
ncbi:MAG: PRC-barrel domain-containing protein [Prochloraceae cyanobacterium]|nr:PRC-barrel domain-containing protein [Prochloraceae cyanobacterium]